jgi:general secretion pathway protein K
MPPWVRAGRRGSRGVALLLTIWVLALLAVVALGLTANLKSGARLARDQLEIARARALADAGFWQVLGRLLDARSTAADRLDGTPHAVVVAGWKVTVSIQDEAGRVDLNWASEAQLRRLFLAIGLGSEAAERLARNIVRYRAAALAQGERDAESRIGQQPGTHRPPQPYVPPFLSKSELRMVEGIRPDEYARILPMVTVHNGDWRINPLAAPGPVLLSLAGIDRAAAERFIAARQTQRDPIALRIAAPPAILQQAAWREPQFITIRSTARLDSSTVAVRDATVALAPAADQPFRILSWTRE